MSNTEQRRAVRALLKAVPIDAEEVAALVEHRGVDRRTAVVAYRLSVVDHVDLAELLAPLLASTTRR